MSLDVKLVDENGDYLYEDNITHNLGQMADRADIYKCLWRPDENVFPLFFHHSFNNSGVQNAVCRYRNTFSLCFM